MHSRFGTTPQTPSRKQLLIVYIVFVAVLNTFSTKILAAAAKLRTPRMAFLWVRSRRCIRVVSAFVCLSLLSLRLTVISTQRPQRYTEGRRENESDMRLFCEAPRRSNQVNLQCIDDVLPSLKRA